MNAPFWRGSVRRSAFSPRASGSISWRRIFATPLIREVLALLLCLFAGGLAVYGYLRWLSNEKAMRLKQDLPYTRTLLVISVLLLAVVAAVMLLVLYGG